MMVGGRVLTTHSNKQLVLSCVIGGDDVDMLTCGHIGYDDMIIYTDRGICTQ